MKHLSKSGLPHDGYYLSPFEFGFDFKPFKHLKIKEADGGTDSNAWDLGRMELFYYDDVEPSPRDNGHKSIVFQQPNKEQTDDAGPTNWNFPKPSGNEDYVSFNEIASAKPPGTPGGGNGGNKGDGGGGDTVLFSYVSGDPGADDSSEFNLQIDFYGDESDWTDNLVEDFEAAADYLSSIVTGDVADIEFDGKRIDDIRIDASLVDIDGSGGVLGQAGPTVIRTANALPVTAVMEFDTADAQDFDDLGLWDEIVLHEMLHSIGFGTIWEMLGLLDAYVDDQGTHRPWDDTVDYRFNGANANQAFEQDFPALFAASDGLGIFVETDGGPGTAGSHWDEEAFDKELMTGYIDASENFISNMTIASLEDTGYETVWNSIA